MAAKKKSAIRRGMGVLKDRPAGGGGSFVSVSDGEQVELVPMVDMDDMVSYDQHAIWLDAGNSPIFACIDGTGEQCPGCQMGEKPRFRAFLPVLTQEGPKIWAFGITMARQLSEIDDAVDGIAGKVMRLRRTGSGINTRYTVITTGKERDVSAAAPLDVEENLGPTDRMGILELLNRAGIDLSAVASKTEVKKLGGKPEPEPEPKEDIAEEESSDEEWGDDWEDGSEKA